MKNQKGLIPQETQEEILKLLVEDNDTEIEKILMEFNQYNPVLFSIPKGPKQLQKSPNIVCAAAYYGAVNTLRFLFQVNINPTISDARGRTVSHYAVYCNKVEILQVLSEMGVSLDTPSNNQKRPIHIAAKHGLTDICQYLWASGIDLKQYDKQGLSPIHYALINEKFETVEFLESAGCSLTDPMTNKSNLYITAIRTNRFDALMYLIEHKVPQTQCEGGNYPIHEAVKAKLDAIVEILLQSGADPCCVNKKLETPLHIAAKIGDPSIATKILDASFSREHFVDPIDIEKKTPLHYAAKFGHVAVLNLLIDFGADIFATDKDGNTAMNLACAKRQFETIDILRGLGMDEDDVRYSQPLKKRSRGQRNSSRSRSYDNLSDEDIYA